jgi:hypothetical protein
MGRCASLCALFALLVGDLALHPQGRSGHAWVRSGSRGGTAAIRMRHFSRLRLSWRRLSRRQLGAATFRAERAQVVLARLQRGGFLVGRTLEIHREPQRANQQASDAGRHILRDLVVGLAAQVLQPRARATGASRPTPARAVTRASCRTSLVSLALSKRGAASWSGHGRLLQWTPRQPARAGRGAGVVIYCVTRRNIPASLYGGDPGARG